MVVVLTVLIVLMALMVMVLVTVMAARDGECHCASPASISASQCWLTRLGRSGAATQILKHIGQIRVGIWCKFFHSQNYDESCVAHGVRFLIKL